MLEAISIQALAQVKHTRYPCILFDVMLLNSNEFILSQLQQCVEIQLGLASECEKATLSVKRRLACEQVSYFSQVSVA
jgi:hypothetical protein